MQNGKAVKHVAQELDSLDKELKLDQTKAQEVQDAAQMQKQSTGEAESGKVLRSARAGKEPD